ncbi:FadR/GntR family transcriptional regulator [Chitinophaga sancti]|nr:FCD domain-containing protein [Chitinophaga sancti]WQD64091.1 FCD domain-containing protein [Chitinophaga sancti]WQG90285.1 FCD domain-containing protein [Chitinophaga sancti]
MANAIKLADKVIYQLQQDISLGKYKAGELIPPEPVLMELFNVGRSTIREAIKTLSNAGILRVQQGAGTFVCSIENNEPLEKRLRRAARMEVNQVRSLLEIEIARLAAQFRDEQDLEQIGSALADRLQAIQSENYEAAADADIRFHKSIALASHNSVLADLYQTFTAVIRDSFSQREKPHVQQFQQTHHLHADLLTAIRKQDAPAATRVVTQILETNF